ATLSAHESVEIVPVDPGETETALRDGLAHVVVVPGDPPRYRYDPARPESRLARQTVDDLLQRAAGRKDVWTGRDEAVTATGSRYIDWLIPGLLGMNIMGTGMWGVGFTLVLQRTRKLLMRLIATPMRRHQYLAALVAARLVLLGLEVAALVGFARLMFGVPVEGSLVALGVVSLLGAMTFSGIGLLTASRAQTIEGVSGIMNVVMAPMWICSGIFFAASNFPDPLQPFIQALPLTALVDALRSIMLDGNGLLATGPELLILAAWCAASFVLALRIFKWR
ncbi:MAG: ABC transporter permease, partial [Acidobacteria bacterium]|nr:ABC transporter permease [Acidobacteriota bacterium]